MTVIAESSVPNVAVEVTEEVRFSNASLSWRAILAGVVIALVLQLLLSILGSAIGLAFIDPTAADNPRTSTMTLVALIWWTLSGILAAWAGGITAGRLCGKPATSTAAWHGLVTWGVTTLLIFYLLTTAIGGIAGGAFAALSTAAGGAATAAGAAAPALAEAIDPFASIETEIKDATGAKDPAAAREALSGFVRTAFTAEAGDAPAATDRAAAALARATGMTPVEAGERLAAWKQEYDATVAMARQAAAEAADAARKAASGAGFLSVIALIFGGLAGWFGGWNSPVPETETPFGRFARSRRA